MAVRVLICHHERLARQGMRLFLERFEDVEIVAEAALVSEAVRLTEATRPQVVVISAASEGTGFDADVTSKTICGRVPEAGVVVISCPADAESVYAAARAGASGFVLPEMGGHELLEAIRAVAAGGAYLAPVTAGAVLADVLALQRTKANEHADLCELTVQEREVLRLLARGCSNAEIGRELFLSESTVKTHLTHVFRKLGVRDRVQAVIKAHAAGVGEIAREPSSPRRRFQVVERAQSVTA